MTLNVPLTTPADPSRSLRITPFIPCHYDAFRSPLLVTCFPKIVIQNGGKNAVWKRRETGQWHRVKNLLRWWRLTVFLTTGIDSSLALVLLSKSSKSLDHMLRKEYTVYCFEILWIGHMLRYHTDGFSESPTTVSLLLCWSVRYRLTVYVERVYKRKEPCGSIQYQE